MNGVYRELADLEGGHDQQPDETLWTRGLLIRRHVGDGELVLSCTWCRKGTPPMATLVGVEGQRWCIEDRFKTAKNELGLDHNQNRSWHGWHRNTALVMLAFAMIAAIRHRANADEVAPKKRGRCGCSNHCPHPLVDPGNPPDSNALGPAEHPILRCDCKVILETGASSICKGHTCKTENATTMSAQTMPDYSPIKSNAARTPNKVASHTGFPASSSPISGTG